MTTQAPERSGPAGAPAPQGPPPPPDVPRESRRDALRYWVAERRIAVAAWLLIVVLIIGALGLWRANVIDPLRLSQPDTAFGMKGANIVERGAFGADIDVGRVGEGEDTTFVIRAKDLSGPQPAVIFLHGFGSSLVVGYEPWIEHLARQGLTVIFPSWQQPPYPTDGTQNPRVNMFRGVRLAVDAVPIRKDKIAVVGLSAGGALAYDYAALGSEIDVPKAGLVYSVYPGRGFPGEKRVMLPLPPAGAMPADTKVVTVVSRKDKEAGTAWGRAQYEALAGRGRELRELTYVKTPGMGGHYAPAEVSRKARITFWQPLDRLLADHLNISLLPDKSVKRAVRAQHAVERALDAERLVRRRAERGQTTVIDGGRGTSGAPGAKPDLP